MFYEILFSFIKNKYEHNKETCKSNNEVRESWKGIVIHTRKKYLKFNILLKIDVQNITTNKK